jgi:hypothetical protein
MFDAQDYELAYRTGCLGITEADWKSLALEALLVGITALSCESVQGLPCFNA